MFLSPGCQPNYSFELFNKYFMNKFCREQIVLNCTCQAYGLFLKTDKDSFQHWQINYLPNRTFIYLSNTHVHLCRWTNAFSLCLVHTDGNAHFGVLWISTSALRQQNRTACSSSMCRKEGGSSLNSHRLITSLLIFKLGLRHPQYKVLSILRWITEKWTKWNDVKAKDHLQSFLCCLYLDTFMTSWATNTAQGIYMEQS